MTKKSFNLMENGIPAKFERSSNLKEQGRLQREEKRVLVCQDGLWRKWIRDWGKDSLEILKLGFCASRLSKQSLPSEKGGCNKQFPACFCSVSTTPVKDATWEYGPGEKRIPTNGSGTIPEGSNPFDLTTGVVAKRENECSVYESLPPK